LKFWLLYDFEIGRCFVEDAMILLTAEVRLAPNCAIILAQRLCKFQAYPLAICEMERPNVSYDSLLAIDCFEVLANPERGRHGAVRW